MTSQQGPRARWLGLLLFCAAACANSSNNSEAAHGASPSDPAKPQQVVQRIAPANPVPSSREGTPPRSPSAAGATGGAVPGAGGAETVTAKHVEAELNRLEAELK